MNMQALKRTLRACVLISIGSFFAMIVAMCVDAISFPEIIRTDAARIQVSEPATESLGLVAVCLLLLLIIAYVGLFRFWKSARALYTSLIVISLSFHVIAPDPAITRGAERLFADINTLTAGVILSLLYFSPLKNLFERPVEPLPPSASS